MLKMTTFPKWQIRTALLMKACYPELAEKVASRAAADVLRDRLEKAASEGKRVDLKPGDTLELDGVKVVIE